MDPEIVDPQLWNVLLVVAVEAWSGLDMGFKNYT